MCLSKMWKIACALKNEYLNLLRTRTLSFDAIFSRKPHSHDLKYSKV